MQAGPNVTPVGAPWTRRDVCALGLLVAVAIGVYANSLPNAFVYDDHSVVVQDERTHSLSRIGELFSGGYWTVTPRPLYRPITLLSFALNHAVTGLSAPGYRAVNLVLHALTCLAVYRLTMLLFGRFWPAMLAGAIYAVHPIHVEAVVPIVGRSELLSGLAVATALVLYVGDAARGGRGLSWRYAVVVPLTWAAMLCKESAIVLVGMVVAFDVWRRLRTPVGDRRGSWDRYLAGRLLHRYGGMALAVVMVLWMRQWAIGMAFGEGVKFPLADNSLVDESFVTRVLTGLVLFGKYVYLLIAGHPLCCDYSPNAIPPARSSTWPVVWGAACLIVLVVGSAASMRRRGGVALSAGWFLVSYAPVANVLVLIGTMFAERLMYLPSVCSAIACGLVVSGSVTWLWRRGSSGARTAAIALIVAASAGLTTYGVLTILRNRTWRDNETVFRDALARQPQSARSQFNMGSWYVDHGYPEEGIEHLRRAVEIVDSYVLARTKLGSCYVRLSRWQDAVDVLVPLVESTRSRSAHLVTPLYLLGRARVGLGQPELAWEAFDRILAIEPRNAQAMSSKAEIMTRQESGSRYSPAEGWALIREAVNLEPDNLAHLARAARIALRQRRLVEAKLYLRRATEAANEKIRQAQANGLGRQEKRFVRSMVVDLGKMRTELKQLYRRRRGSQPATTQARPASSTAASDH